MIPSSGRTAAVSAFSSRGKVRQVNEDRASINGRVIAEEVSEMLPLDSGNHLLLVADGMGGHALGDLASTLAIEIINSHGQELQNLGSCIAVLREANQKIYNATLLDPARRGMGTTVVGASINSESIIWFNVGDSRAYLSRDNVLKQLSIDHIPSGDTGPRGRRTHSITQSLGGTYRPVDIWPAVGTVPRMAGDRLLLCSDGLSDLVSDAEIQAWLREEQLGVAVKGLVELALERGAPDNVTAVVAIL